MSKSLVEKWNKDRCKILAELALNKQKKNVGGLRASRQRRKIVGEKTLKE